MQCERAAELVSPYLDGELSPEDREAVAAHIKDCRACAALLDDFRRIGRAIADSGREALPRSLALDVRAVLAKAAAADARPDQQAPVERVAGAGLSAVRTYARHAAALAAACMLSALAGWWIASASEQSARLERDVLSAHVRALLQDSQIQVASSDAHTVKPWFAGRIDFAPDVKDLAAEGFPLLGGRLDYIAGRRVGAIVYKRRLHTVSVFMWPGGEAGSAPRLVTLNGYNILSWSRHGLAYWAISDLAASDLTQLMGLL